MAGAFTNRMRRRFRLDGSTCRRHRGSLRRGDDCLWRLFEREPKPKQDCADNYNGRGPQKNRFPDPVAVANGAIENPIPRARWTTHLPLFPNRPALGEVNFDGAALVPRDAQAVKLEAPIGRIEEAFRLFLKLREPRGLKIRLRQEYPSTHRTFLGFQWIPLES